jgi:hypothetical protein
LNTKWNVPAINFATLFVASVEFFSDDLNYYYLKGRFKKFGDGNKNEVLPMLMVQED